MVNALGLIETAGLTAAIEAADTAVKAANVRLIGYELARDDGYTCVKVEGDVGAVKAAVDSARASAAKIGRVVSTQVIPRPAKGTEAMAFSKATVGLETAAPKKPAPKAPSPKAPPPEPEVQSEGPEPEPVKEPESDPVKAEPPNEEAPKEPDHGSSGGGGKGGSKGRPKK
jgi:microcompartment protein CcmL/EutN